MSTILDDILAHKGKELEAAKRARSEADLTARIADAPPVRDFAGAIAAARGVALIAEVKKASPSVGVIREDFDPVPIAGIYASHGASCISVLTDERFFQGRLQDLEDVRATVAIPVLRKDFLIDPYQVLEARAAGADCILLIAECLDDCGLRELHDLAAEFGMESLIEIYEPDNLDRVLELEPKLLGVNNRNLTTFVTDLDHTLSLRRRIPDDVLLVSESGIRTRDDVERLQSAGVAGILVGETLMRSPDIGRQVDELLGRSHPPGERPASDG
ncbi:MAG: indole-3-glycerol phosphate synthase TrpC [Planctomycetaceae bacterium]